MVIWLLLTLMAWCLTSIVVAFFVGQLFRTGLAAAQPSSPRLASGGRARRGVRRPAHVPPPRQRTIPSGRSVSLNA